jgi:hypothetical protein
MIYSEQLYMSQSLSTRYAKDTIEALYKGHLVNAIWKMNEELERIHGNIEYIVRPSRESNLP